MATKQDSTTRDIKDRLRGAFSRAPKYATSTAKMFLASGKDFFNIQMPIIGGMLETNQDLIRDTVAFLRNPVDSVNKQIDTALNSENFKELKRFGQNALEDLKSGNLYDPNRDRSEFGMNVDALLSDFGGFDMDGFDENGDWDESNINVSGIEGEKAIAEVQEENASKRTAATIDAIGASTEAVVNTNNANAQMNLKMSMKQHAQLMSAMQNSITAQTATFELMNKSINASLDVTREAHNQMMSQINDIKGLLSEIRDAVKPPKEEKEYKEQDEIFGPNGELNIRNWLKQVKKNADEKYSISSSISMATGGIDFKTFMSTIADNPWKLVTDYLVGQLVPESTKKQMSRTNRNASNFFSALLNKAYSRGQAFERGDSDSFLDAFLGLLGVPQRSRTMIDTEYQNPLAPAQFTSKTTRAIEEVIPMWLSRIYSAVSGNPLEVYNYKTGKYERAANIVNRTERNARDLVGRMGDTGRMMFERARAYKWETDEDRKEFEDFLYRYLQRVGERSEFVNPYLTREEFTRNFPDTSKKDQYYNLLYGILKGIPYDQLMQISRDVSEARQARNRSNFDINKELKESGLISAYSLNDDFLEKVKSRSTLTYESLGEVELDALSREHMEAVRKAGNTVAGTNVILNDILGTLRKGIITYSYDLGLAPTKLVDDSTETSSAGRQMSELIQNVLDQSSRQRNIELNIQQKQLDQKAYAARRTQDEKKRAAAITMDPTKPWVENLLAEGMSADVAEQYQQAVNIKLNPEDPNNKGSKRYQELFDKVVDDQVKMLRTEADNLQRGSKIGGILSFARQAAREPFRLFEQGLQIMDNFMFKALFGEDAMEGIEDKGEPYLLQVLTHSLDVHFANAKDWFAKNIGDPLKHFFLDKDTGLLPRIGSAFDETFGISEKAGKIKTKVKEKASEIKTKFTGTKDEATGLWSGGILSETINKIGEDKVTIADYIKGSIDRLLYGDLVAKKGHDIGFVLDDQGRWVESEKYSGVIGTLKKGFKTTTAFLFGEGEDYDKSMDRLKKMKDEVNKALPNMVIDAGIGLVGSFFLPGGPLLGALLGSVAGLVQGSDSIKNVLFGEMTDDFKKDKDGNLILGDDGKPIPTGTQSRKGGMISQQVYDGFRQYAPKVGVGALIGGALGTFGLLPFGMGQMAGAIIGGMGGMLGASEQVKELIFGDGINDDSGVISKNFRKKVVDQVKRYAPAGIGGAALGGLLGQGFGLLPGLSLLPGGPIFSFLGATMGLANADKINEFFFGTEATKTVPETDPETGKVSYVQRTIREGGIFNKMTDFARDHMLKPFTNKINEAGAKISEWFQNDIYGPLSRTLDPLKAELTKAGSSILESMKNIGNTITEAMFNAIGIAVNDKDGKGGLRAFFQEHIIDPMKNMANRMFSAIGKAIGTLLSAPFKALEFIVTGDIGGKDDLDDDRAAKRKDKQEKKNETVFERIRNKVRSDTRKKDLNRAKRSFGRAGAHVGGFFSRFFGDSGDTKGAGGGTGTRPTGPSGQSTHEKDDFGLTNPGMEPGAAFAADMKKAREASVNNEAKKQETKDNLEDKQTTTQSAKNAAETEKATRERTTRIRGKSNNQLLTSIEKYIRKIYHEMDGQINGVGWNTAYIRALLDKQFGGLSAEELPEEMEGSKRKIRRRRTIIGRAKDRVFDFFGGIRDRAVGVVSGARDRVAGLFEIVLKPFRLAGKAAELLFTVVKGVGSGIIEAAKVTGSIMKKILLGAAEGLGRTLAGVGRLIYKAAGGLGEALGNVASTLTGVLHDLTLAVTSTALGLVQTVAAIAPDVLEFIWKGATGLGKMAWKGIKGGVKGIAHGVGAGLSWLGSKLTGKKREKAKTKRIGTFEISGGHLDEVGETFIKIGDKATPDNFPIINVHKGFASVMNRKAIPVYILGSDPMAVINSKLLNVPSADGGEGPTPSAPGPDMGGSSVPGLADPITLWAGTKGVTTDAAGNVVNVERTKEDAWQEFIGAATGAKTLLGSIKEAFSSKAYYEFENGKLVKRDGPPEDAIKTGKNSYVRKVPTKAPPIQNADAIIEAQNKNSKANNLASTDKYVKTYAKVDRQAERSRDPKKVYDDAIAKAQTREEVEAVLAVQQANANNAVTAATSTSEKSEKSESFFDQLIKEVLPAALGIALPLITMVGGIGSGETQLVTHGAENIMQKILRGLGIDNLSPNQIKSVIDNPAMADSLKKDIAGEAAEKGGKKAARKAARGKTTVGILGNLSEFASWITNPSNADAAIDLGKETGGIKGFGMQVGGKAAKAINKVGTAAGSAVSTLKSKVTSVVGGLLDKIINNSVVQQIAGKLAPKLKSIKSKIIAAITEKGLDKAVKQVGSKTIGSLVRQLGGVSTGFLLTAGFAIVDFYTGMNDAYKAFGVSASDCTIGMKIATGITRALTGAISAIPVPVLTTVLSIALSFVESNIAQIIYTAVADDSDEAEWKQNQQELQDATNAYNEANGTDLTTTEYAKQFNNDGTKRAGGVLGAIRDFGSNIGGLIGAAGSSIFNGAKGLLGKAGDFLGGVGNTVWNGLKGIGGGIADFAGNAWSGIKGAAGKVGEFFSGIPGAVEDFGHTFWQGVGGAAFNVQNFFTDTLPGAVNGFITDVGDFLKGVPEWAAGVKDNVVNFFTNTVPTQVGNFFNNAKNFVTQTIPETAGSIVEGAKSAVGGAVENVKKAAAGAVDFLTTDMPEKIGNFFGNVKTFVTEEIPETASNVVRKAGEAASNALSSAKDAAGKVVNNVVSGVKGIASTVGGFFSDLFGGIAEDVQTGYSNAKEAAGKGPMKHFKQSDPRWNRPGSNMAMTGCGPTVAAMVASAYGKGPANPGEADTMSKTMGMRMSDGGTDPAFFKQYARTKGFGMEQGPTSTGMISSNLSKGRPVVLMGKGGAFGGNDHYLVADKLAGKGKVNVTDPITGGSKAVGMDALLRNTNTTIYSYGKGPIEANANASTTEAQNALVAKMRDLQAHPIPYSLQGPQDPDKGSASCASTVGWAYRKVLGINGMSASSRTQAKDDRFTDIVRLGPSDTQPGKTFDLSVLQPGDIVYMYNKGDGWASNHTEMYVGNGKDLSHGGPDPGPQERTLDAARQKKVWAVRRYKPFVDNDTVKILASDGLTGGTYSSTTNDGSQATDGNDKSAGGQFLTSLSNYISNAVNPFNSVLNQVSGGMLGLSESSGSSSSTTGSNFNFGSGAYTKFSATESANRIWQALKNFGYTDYAASGIMGCWQAESSNRADRVEGDYLRGFPGFQKVLASNNALNDYTTNFLFPAYQRSNISISKSGYKGNDGNYYPGIGLAQWTGPRGYNLFKYAVDNNKDWRDLDTQLAFFNSEIASRGLKDTLNSATSASDAARKMLDGYEMYSGYSSKAPSAFEKRAGYANGIYENYAGSGSSDEDKSTTSTGKGPGLEEFDDALNYGKGPSANLEAMNNQISAINAQIKKAKQQTDDESTASKLTKSVTDAIEKTVSTGDTNSDVINVLSTSLSKMIELLAAIKDNTDPKNNQSGPTSGQQRELPTVRADNFGADGTNTGVGTNTEDIGATIMNTLTAR